MIDTTTNNGSYTGDPAKTAFGKVNDNFTECYTNISSAASAASAAQSTANAAMPKTGGTFTGGITTTQEVHANHISIGQDSSHGAGNKYFRGYTLADKTNAQVQVLFSGGSTTGNDGNVDVYCNVFGLRGTGIIEAKGYRIRAGINASSYGTNQYNWYWTGSQLHAWVDTTDLGYLSFNSSDKRIKQDIDYVSDFDGDLAIVLNLKPVEFRYKEGTLWDDGKRHRSLIADDAYGTDSMLVGGTPGQTNDDGSIMPMGLDANALFSRLIGSVHALNARIAALESALQVASASADSGS